jgi:hypothetical protein
VKREQFEHLIAAAANVIGEDEFVVIGSQAVLGSVETAPPSMLISMEADIYPATAPDRAIEIDGALGDGSPFHRQYGYYATV